MRLAQGGSHAKDCFRQFVVSWRSYHRRHQQPRQSAGLALARVGGTTVLNQRHATLPPKSAENYLADFGGFSLVISWPQAAAIS